MARKKAGGHHGGAWKVAYADFVTAMMAFFMVMWLCAQDNKLVISVQDYFRHPFKVDQTAGFGLMPTPKKPASTDNKPVQEKEQVGSEQHKAPVEVSYLNSVAAQIYKQLNIDEKSVNKPIDIVVTSDGLRVTIYDRSRQPLFKERSAEFTSWGNLVITNLAWLIDRHRFAVMIDGHTRANETYNYPNYGPWELSTERANTTRRQLVHYAVDDSKITRVTGYAATVPLKNVEPDSEDNQRITISLSLTKPKGPYSDDFMKNTNTVIDPYAQPDSVFGKKNL